MRQRKTNLGSSSTTSPEEERIGWDSHEKERGGWGQRGQGKLILGKEESNKAAEEGHIREERGGCLGQRGKEELKLLGKERVESNRAAEEGHIREEWETTEDHRNEWDTLVQHMDRKTISLKVSVKHRPDDNKRKTFGRDVKR